MKIGIASHIVVDSIKDANGNEHESLGGPPCYCGLTSRQLGFEVDLATKVGGDFSAADKAFLRTNGLSLKENQIISGAETTRFNLFSDKDSRKLVLKSKCTPLSIDDIQNMDVDCWIVNPVIDEVPEPVLKAIVDNCGRRKFVMLDPQGYMRKVENSGRITHVEKLQLNLSGINAIKVDSEELAALTGLDGLEGMMELQSKGIEFIVYTGNGVVNLLHDQTHYWIKMKKIDTPDSTGAGDILGAAFCCTYVKENDPLWALCFGAGAVRAALEARSVGLQKIPSGSKIEQNASYYYGSVGFQKL